MKKFILLFFALLLGNTYLLAQQVPASLRSENLVASEKHFTEQQNPQSNQPQTTDKKSKSKASAPTDDEATKINLVTGQGDVSEKNYQPLNNKQRLQLWLNGSFTTPGAYLGSIGVSLLDQASGTPKEWGGGMKGYGRRLASRMGTNIVQGAIQSSTAALLGLDPRYIRSSSTHLTNRIGHALLFGVMTYNNAGKMRLNIANIASFYGSALITTTWQPKSNSDLNNGLKDGSRQVVFSGLSNIVQEFWPDVIKRFKHH